MGLMAILMCYYHTWGAEQVLLAPVIMLFIGAAAAGIGTFIAAMTVRYRDVKYVLPFVLQIGLFATPSVYMPTGVQKAVGLKLILAANPMTALIGAFRAACLGGPIPWSSAIPAAALGVILLFVGCLYFQRIEDRFADEI
jgi:lipopolysaccharide transport system permease protein